jgi:4-amino-4-deoxy-L-arabinose transferase-like glycosyltransferase
MAKRPTLASPTQALRRVPRAAWICALVACLNAACWSILTPPFQATDEPDHFAYVKQLAETGQPPTSSSEQLSPEELTVLRGVRDFQVRQQPQDRTIASESQQRELDEALARARTDPTTGSPAAGVADSQPPLYYALESVPYLLASGGSELARLQAMRLMSALFAGLTALFVFLFVREALPAARWTWTVAGLAVALAPLLGFMSGSVNPDSMLYAVSAAVFYVIARAFRRGLTARSAAAIGVLTALGLVTKLNFIGLAPGVVLSLLVLGVRARRDGRLGYRPLAFAGAIALAPAVLFIARNALAGRPAFGIVSSTLSSTHGSLLTQVSYTWQLYLPRLPGMANYFPGLLTTRQLWFDGYVGLYGWLDTPFPGWVYTLALVPAGALALLCGRSLYRARSVLRARATELATYAVMAVGLLVLIGSASFRAFPATDAEYAQARYLLPLLPLLGASLALAARGAGRRWGPIAGVAIVVLFAAHDVFSQLQVIARYYG